MAGTPTPNYNFPTYAETDVPDLAGAYNQAVNAIDAKIKEVADTIPSDVDVPDANSTTKGIAKLYDSTTVGSGTQDDGGITPKAVDDKIDGSLTGYTPKFTATAPITYSENKIGIRYSNPTADGSQNGYGAVQVTGKQQDVANADSLTTATVPNVKAVKDYVDAKVPVEQQAYTGTAPIVVNNGSRNIRINLASGMSWADDKYTGGSAGAVIGINSDAFIHYMNNDDNPPNVDRDFIVPSIVGIKRAILSRTPDASTSAKGLVQLAAAYSGANTTQAATGGTIAEALSLFLNDWADIANAATTPLTTEMLANLYVTPSGMVVYKAPSE